MFLKILSSLNTKFELKLDAIINAYAVGFSLELLVFVNKFISLFLYFSEFKYLLSFDFLILGIVM